MATVLKILKHGVPPPIPVHRLEGTQVKVVDALTAMAVGDCIDLTCPWSTARNMVYRLRNLYDVSNRYIVRELDKRNCRVWRVE